MQKKTMLFVGDFLVTTGFARVNHNILERLDPEEWDIHVLGINVSGDYHPLQAKFKIYPAHSAGDLFGFGRIVALIEAIAPDVVVFHQDAWNIARYIDIIKARIAQLDPDGSQGLKMPKMVAYIPADAPNQSAGKQINDVLLLLAPTEFGVTELAKGGYVGATGVVEYGVDTNIYRPMNRLDARRAMNYPDHVLDAFVFGRADRNAPRKRYDLTLRYFRAWLNAYKTEYGGVPNAYLHLHCAPKDVGFDLEQLSEYYHLEDRVIFTSKEHQPGQAGSEERLRKVMCCWDAHWSCTLGEGFGLVALDSMACGIPQILPQWSGFESWVDKDAALWVPCTSVQHHTTINTVGGVADEQRTVAALTMMYTRDQLRSALRVRALKLANDPKFRWENIAHKFNERIRHAATT